MNHTQTHRKERPGRMTAFRHSAGGSAVACLCLVTFGCGGGGPAPAPAPQPAGGQAATTQAPATGGGEATSTDAAAAASGQKWLGKVPYDVFYGKPVEMVGQPQELGAIPVATVAASTTTPGTTATGTPSMTSESGSETTAAPAAGGSWSSAISGELIDAESKAIRNRLTQNLQSLSTYNRSIDAIGQDAIIMAALAGVAERYDGDMRWKERAAAVRHLAYTVYEKNGGKGRKAFDDTLAPFERMGTILDGGPTDGVEFESDIPLPDYADRTSLMERMKVTFEWMRGNIASEDNLRSKQEDVNREGAVLAMIAEIIKQPGYDYHEEKNYQKFCNDFLTASIDVRDSAQEVNYEKFKDALGRIQTSCGNCHGEYAFGSDGL